MNTACNSCAFGTAGAASEPANRLRGMICAGGARPFFCHHGRDGAEYDWRNHPAGPLLLAPSNRKICAGWQAAVKNLADQGYFDNRDYLVIRRAVTRRAFDLVEEYLSNRTRRGKKPFLLQHIQRCVRFLGKRDIEHEEIPL